MIPAAFDYLRASTHRRSVRPSAAAGADARVLAGGQSLIPAMRFRLARPAVLVDINAVERSELHPHGRSALTHRRHRARQRRRARAVDRRAAVEPHSRRLARGRRSGRAADGHGRRQPVPQRSRRRLDGGRARVARRTSSCAARPAPARSPSTSSSSTASRRPSGKARWRWRVRFPVPDDRTAGSYQKVERKVGDFATAAAAVQVSLNADGTIRDSGRRAVGRRTVRRARRRGRGAADRSETDRRSDSRRFRRRVERRASRRPTCAAASSTRSIWLACSSRAACARRSRVWGCRHEGQHHGERRRVREGRRAAHAARVLPARRLRADRHARRLRHLELRLLRRRHGRRRGR